MQKWANGRNSFYLFPLLSLAYVSFSDTMCNLYVSPLYCLWIIDLNQPLNNILYRLKLSSGHGADANGVSLSMKYLHNLFLERCFNCVLTSIWDADIQFNFTLRNVLRIVLRMIKLQNENETEIKLSIFYELLQFGSMYAAVFLLFVKYYNGKWIFVIKKQCELNERINLYISLKGSINFAYFKQISIKLIPDCIVFLKHNSFI